jgi:hypothetical protein
MSVEADFHEAKGIFQAAPTVAWEWEMGDLNRFMAYSVVPGQANQAVSVAPPTVRQDNNSMVTVRLVVTLAPFDRGGSPPGLINFFAARIPPL